jgi:hypothetical protein
LYKLLTKEDLLISVEPPKTKALMDNRPRHGQLLRRNGWVLQNIRRAAHSSQLRALPAH